MIELKKPTAKRDEPQAKRDKPERAKAEAAPSKPQASGQIFCDGQGCRPVGKDCRVEPARIGLSNPRMVCN
jgi:hypothetical protein